MSQPFRIHHHHPSSYSSIPLPPTLTNNVIPSSFSISLFLSSISFFGIRGRSLPSLTALPQQKGSLQQEKEFLDSPISVDLIPICSESQFDQIIARTQQFEHPLIIVWMAKWCRTCIYLKPKLEKLAAEYYPRLQFYSVDVNAVPHKLVARAGVTKMPTIQLWKDGKIQAEVIGGRKAHWVIGDVQEMIENECTM